VKKEETKTREGSENSDQQTTGGSDKMTEGD